jgi:hypothetical protein
MRARWRLVLAEPAAQLAALRIVVPAMILVCPETRHAPEIAAGPAALRVAPEGLGWFVAHVPITPVVATTAQAVCVFSALCAAVGLKARHALVAMTLSAFYLFSLSQLAGAVWHDMHLLWMAALLAASPCDEALAYDRRGQPPPSDSTRYGWPLLFARLLLACVYFFPGFHKLATSGLAWALSDNLQHQLWWKWAQHGVRDPVRVDRVPGLLQAGGLFVLAFELSFPVLVLVPRARPWLAAAGVAFHVMAGLLFRIPFVSLWALYVVLIDPRRLVWWRRSAPAPAPAPVHAPAPAPALLVTGSLLVALAAVQGARGQMRAYPFACYPTFQWRVGAAIPDLLIELEMRDGSREVLRHARDARGYRTQRQWGEVWSLAGIHGHPGEARLRAYLEQLRRSQPVASLIASAVRVRFFRAYLSAVPEERDAPPRRDELLLNAPMGIPSVESP